MNLMKSQLIPWAKDEGFGPGIPSSGLVNSYFEENRDFMGIHSASEAFPHPVSTYPKA